MDEYAAIVKAYTNRKGDIRDHIVGVKLENLSGNKSLSDAQVRGIVEMLDQVSRRGVFKELNDEIRKLLAR